MVSPRGAELILSGSWDAGLKELCYAVCEENDAGASPRLIVIPWVSAKAQHLTRMRKVGLRAILIRPFQNPEIVTDMLYEVLRTSLRVPDGSYGPY